jgi:hypothetical protein
MSMSMKLFALITCAALSLHLSLWSADADEEKQAAANEQAYALLEKQDTETLIKEFGTIAIPLVDDWRIRGDELQIRLVQGDHVLEDRRIALKYLKDDATPPKCRRMISRSFESSTDLDHLEYILAELRVEQDPRKRGPLYFEAADNGHPAISKLAADLIPQAMRDREHPHPTVGNGADWFLRAIRQEGLDHTTLRAWGVIRSYLKEHGGSDIKDPKGARGTFTYPVIRGDKTLYFSVVLKDNSWVVTPVDPPK